MRVKFVAGFLALAVSATAAQASSWYFVDSAASNANITFIDRDSIRTDSGYVYADLFTLLATPADGRSAFRFITRYDCDAGKSQLTGGQSFDLSHKPREVTPIDDEWQPAAPGTQGARILKVVCAKGVSLDDKDAAGSDWPFERGAALLKAFIADSARTGT